MKLSPLNNSIAFGYNRNLNRRLEKRLQEGNQGLNCAIGAINQSCIQTENYIKKLEKEGLKTDNFNTTLIDKLSEYFCAAKAFLCVQVDNLFPELNYSEIESETYMREQADFTEETIDSEYCSQWREDFIEALDNAKSTDESPLESLFGADSDTKDTMLEPFIPFSYSPKGLDDVIGLKNSKERIENLVIYPLSHPKEAKKRKENYGIDIPGFILLYGPPGCGKTMLAEAIATQTGCKMFNLNISRVGLPYINVTTTRITKAFKEAEEVAKKSDKPVIIFMDEADTFLRRRGAPSSHDSSEDTKVINTLLPLITQAKDKNIVIIGSTNMYESLDPAAKRRVDLSLYIGLPDKKDIETLLKKNLSTFKMGKPLAQNEKDIVELAKMLKGYNPSSIVNMVKSSGEVAYSKNREVRKEDFIEVLEKHDWTKINEQEYLPDNKKRSTRIGF